jgi:hypothetical protein
MNCSRQDQMKEEARTARERPKPEGAGVGPRQVLSCEQERGKRKVKPRASIQLEVN